MIMNFQCPNRGLTTARTPGCAAFVLSAPGVCLAGYPVLTGKPLQRPRTLLQRLKFLFGDKIRVASNLGSVLALLWGQSAIACAVRARVMSAGTFPAFPPP